MPAPPLPAPPDHLHCILGRGPERASCSAPGTARSAARLGACARRRPSHGLRAREPAVLVQSGAAACWRRGQLLSRRATLRSAGAGGRRLQVAASDARAGLSRRPLEGSRRSSGARPRHGGRAPPVRAGAGSSGSGARAKHMAVGASGGCLGRPHPPRPVCTGVFGVFSGPRGSLRVSCGDFSNGRDGLSGQLGPLCKVPRIFCKLYSQHPSG